MQTIRIAMAQINPIVGDLQGNAKKILEYIDMAKSADTDIVVFPELAVTGYPPEDLLLKPKFVSDNIKYLKSIACKTKGIIAVVGFVDNEEGLYNSAAVIHNEEVSAVYHKMFLPNYGVFDEDRYFKSGNMPLNILYKDIKIGIGICEDIWYQQGPARAQASAGAYIIININASPYNMGKAKLREEMIKSRAIDNNVIIAYLNMVGGQDELVFDGQSMIVDEKRNIIAMGKAFEEDYIVADLDMSALLRVHRRNKEELAFNKSGIKVKEIVLPDNNMRKKKTIIKTSISKTLEPLQEVYSALVLGTSDYVIKNGFKRVIVGLSGGVDSALVAIIASDALQNKNVTGVFMPSQYSSRESREDAISLAKNVGIEFMEISIKDIFEKYLKLLSPVFKKRKTDATEENIQARIRGNILMAISNKLGSMVLTTGNKSEMSVGYATLYGDMAGGFAVIKDVPKTLVYELARYRNSIAKKIVIPERILIKAPTAELRPNQTDQDTLPPYEILDRILKAYIEENKSLDEIKEMGLDCTIIKNVINMVDASEYKRRQSPPGIKITARAFGKDRRMPITNKYESF